MGSNGHLALMAFVLHRALPMSRDGTCPRLPLEPQGSKPDLGASLFLGFVILP